MTDPVPSKLALRIALLYAFFAAVWILFSDQLIRRYFSEPTTLTLAATAKGWVFVAVTATMLFVLIRRQLRVVGQTALARKRAEEAVQISEERLRALAALSPDIISIFDRDGRMTFNSAAALRIHGYTEKELVGRSTFDLIHPDDQAAVRTAFESMLADPARVGFVRYRYRNANGSYTWMEAAGRNELGNPHISGIIAVSRDISERVSAENALRESEERFQRLVSSMSDIMFATDLKGAFTFIGPQVSQFGYSQEEIVGRSLLEFVHPEDRSRVAGDFEKAVTTGNIVGDEFRIKAKDGSVAWLHERSGFILSRDGVKIGVSGMLQDTTEKRRADEERRVMQDQLTQAQKMEAIGQLAGGIAHDFNNILTVFSMYLALLEVDPSADQVRAACGELKHATERATSLTRQLLLFARRQVVQKRELDLDVLLGRLLNMLRRLIGENISVEYCPAPRPAWVLADAGMLEQVVMNLIVNARDSMRKGGRLRIVTSFERFDEVESAKNQQAGRRPGDFVCLAVSDTGDGMDAETQRKIFEPFFTTKEAGKGTGLGLATVFGIVQQHDGWIEVESALGRGSTFRVFLPESRPPPPEIKPATRAVAGGKESILLTEDDPSVRQLTLETLEQLGYRVATAGTGQEAVNIWTENRGAFDLLLTDMIMPEGLTGLDVAKILRLEKPALKVIVMSGYSLELSQHGALEAERIAYLAKPFDPPELARAVREVLGQPIV